MKNKIILPEEAQYILDQLNASDEKAYMVGGCVRDILMGISPKDWDITTSASPDIIKSLFDKTYDTGIKYGTVTVQVNQSSFEVTTFRTDGQYADNRKPDSVIFTNSIHDDLGRRDFTMNSIAYHPKEGFIDPFDGSTDIDAKIIRCVGNPNTRFNEDALRILRAVRFSAQLDFEIEAGTLKSIKENASLLSNISDERIRDEYTKLLTSKNPFKLTIMKDTDILKFTIPELIKCFETTQINPHHAFDVGLHTLHTIANIESMPYLRWTMLLHDIGKPATKTTDEKGIDHFYGHVAKSEALAENILSRLKFDSKSTKTILTLIKYHDKRIDSEAKSVRKAVSKIGDEYFPDLLKVKKADIMGQSLKFQKVKLMELDKIKNLYKEIKRAGDCLTLEHLDITGDDLIDMGYKPGKLIGEMLRKMLDLVIEDPSLNKKALLINWMIESQ